MKEYEMLENINKNQRSSKRKGAVHKRTTSSSVEEVSPPNSNNNSEKTPSNKDNKSSKGRQMVPKPTVHSSATINDKKDEKHISIVSSTDTVHDLENTIVEDEEDGSCFRISKEILGTGAFGNVYMGLNIKTSELVAVKELRLDGVDINGSGMNSKLSKMEDEISVMKALHHPNIVRYLGTSRQNGHLYIFLEFMADGCIAKLLKRFGPLGEENVKNYLRQILSGLNYLHQNKIIHRDIKGGNILVKDAVAKLADFGCSLQFEGDASVEQVRNKSLLSNERTNE